MFDNVKFIIYSAVIFVIFNIACQVIFNLTGLEIHGSALRLFNASSLFLSILFSGYLSAGRSLKAFKEVIGFKFNESYKGVPYIILSILLSILFLFFINPIKVHPHGIDMMAIFFAVFSAVFISPVLEEVIFRGYLFSLVETNLGRWSALVFTSFIFVVLHTGYELRALMILSVFSTIFGIARMVTGSVYCSILMHVIFNATAFIGFAITFFV